MVDGGDEWRDMYSPVVVGGSCEIRLEDLNSGELCITCFLSQGTREYTLLVDLNKLLSEQAPFDIILHKGKSGVRSFEVCELQTLLPVFVLW
ncbi:hypothetical protein RJT34_18995 [Clitoria ternatea]|uniref:Uncharacterized protein n=1 Tax=Clitoria ternatea TaxID=43366 RepID=A0AAN9P312_CLITE